VKARELRLMAVALGGLALVVAARGGEVHQGAVTVDDPHGSQTREVSVLAGDQSAPVGGEAALPGLGQNLGGLAGGDAIHLLDFGEVDQSGATCSEGVEGVVPRTIAVTQGESDLVDENLFSRLEVDNAVVYADLDGDGSDEAVVHTVCAYGANGAQDSIQVWDFASGSPKLKASMGEAPASVSGPFPPAVKQITVDGDTVAVTWSHWDNDDLHCCASLQTTVRYRLDGNELKATGTPETTPAG
jgi:hypothetical protein